MIIVDLQELENRAQAASHSIGGVVLEPEAVLLIVSEIRRMKVQLGEQHGHLAGMQNELLQLRTELIGSLSRDLAQRRSIRPVQKAKLKMKVITKDAQGHDDAAG